MRRAGGVFLPQPELSRRRAGVSGSSQPIRVRGSLESVPARFRDNLGANEEAQQFLEELGAAGSFLSWELSTTRGAGREERQPFYSSGRTMG